MPVVLASGYRDVLAGLVVVQRDLIVLFAGTDDKGGGIDVRVGGVPYALRAGGAVQAVSASGVPATLHVGFAAPSAAAQSNSLVAGAF